VWPKLAILSIPTTAKFGLVIFAAAETAQAVTDGWQALLNMGAIGCVLVYQLARAEPRLQRIERAIDRQSRGGLIMGQMMDDIASGRKVSEMTKVQARDLINEIDAANGKS
jgi:hypothetical protein